MYSVVCNSFHCYGSSIHGYIGERVFYSPYGCGYLTFFLCPPFQSTVARLLSPLSPFPAAMREREERQLLHVREVGMGMAE